MNRFISLLLGAAALMLPGTTIAQEQTPPSREMRSAWVATVWRLDWPQTVISETGNLAQIARQKQQMTDLLDSLAINNFNAINFQVRSRSDAFYHSSYEPWSSDLVDTRGKDPGWDPLEWVVAECHRRGLECHAWVNPYRYESVAGQWNGTPNAYRETHPDWIMDVTNSSGTTASILNPGKPEVTEHICKIIKEIVENYDIDGVLFDDYFYLSGTNRTHDGDLYDNYVANGGTLDIYDWRRSNVNNMVAAVYSTIKATKPWVRFGVSPAGIACTSSTVAASYGIPRCPTGSDWQYNDIYSDPIAWISRQSLDFISPQIYWTIGYSTNYDAACKWWSMVANKWERHLFVSHSISSLTASSKSPGMSCAESDAFAASEGQTQYASGPNNTSFQEYVDEINLNRAYNHDDAPGSIFYSAKYIYRIAPLFGHYLRNKAFTTHCLPPAMTWMGAPVPDPVENFSLSGSRLTWNGAENMRYTVYAYPESFSDIEKVRLPEYLLGITYTPEYTIDDKYLSGYTFGVCAYDRYGNESSLAIPGKPAGELAAPVTVYPAPGETVEAPFDFSWTTTDNASEFIVEIASDKEMTQRIDQRSTMEKSIQSSKFVLLPLDTPLYWRVRSCSAGYRDGVSEPMEFFVSQLRILSPSDDITTETLTPTFTYSMENRELTLEIATKGEFGEKDIVYTSTHTGNHTVADYALSGGQHYYARVRYNRGDDALVSPTVEFNTPAVDPVVPSIANPAPGADLHSDEHIILAPIAGPSVLRVEVSETESFPVRASYFNSKVGLADMTDPKTGKEIRIGGKGLVDGNTYYCRARATFRTADGGSVQTDYCEPVPFVYRASESGITEVSTENRSVRIDGHRLIAIGNLRNLNIYDAAGTLMASAEALSDGQYIDLDLTAGVYLVSAQGMNPVKIIIR